MPFRGIAARSHEGVADQQANVLIEHSRPLVPQELTMYAYVAVHSALYIVPWPDVGAQTNLGGWNEEATLDDTCGATADNAGRR